MGRSGRVGHLSPAQMDALPPGSHVIDGNSDISTKRADGLWEGFEMGPLTSAKLHKYGPIRRWVGAARRAQVRH